MDTASPSFSLDQFRRPSRWITRERPKIDRIACPWLVLRRIDPQAEFLDAPTSEVLREARRLNAIAHDIPGTPVSHKGGALYAWCQGAQAKSQSWNPAAMAGPAR